LSSVCCQHYADVIGSARANCYEFCPTTKCWPGTAAGQAACTAYYTVKGWDITGCNCTVWAAANGQDASRCTATRVADCDPFWQGLWNARTVASADLTVSSPNWCNYRGDGIRSCCGSGWWKFDFDPYNTVNPGNCVMKSGTEWGEACENRVWNMVRWL